MQTLPADGCIKRLHVNQNLLRKAIAGEDVCPYTVQYKGKRIRASQLTLTGECLLLIPFTNHSLVVLACSFKQLTKLFSLMTIDYYKM